MTLPHDGADQADRPLKVRLVLDGGNRDWILGKFADRLRKMLPANQVQAEIAEEPSPDADVNHWMFYGHPWMFFFQEKRRKLTRSTAMITHVDDPIKLRMLREVLHEVVDVGICMSRMTMEDLIGRGLPRERLCYVLPAHDGNLVPRRLVVGITSRVYPDGRKRETLLIDLARALPLDLFHFEILGRGWEPVIPHLEAAGATVQYYPGTDDYVKDYEVLCERLRTFDYFVYTGLDEGSMGILDALAVGAETIVTRQGFHLDVEDGITHGFWDGGEFIEIFKKISERRRAKLGVVKHLTWERYARQHAQVWRALCRGEPPEPACRPYTRDDPWEPPKRSRMAAVRAELSFWRNTFRSAFFRHYFDRRKWEVRCVLSKWKRRMLRFFQRNPRQLQPLPPRDNRSA